MTFCGIFYGTVGISIYIMHTVGRPLNKEMDSSWEWSCSNGGTILTVWETKETTL
jgi:hypothetical protein